MATVVAILLLLTARTSIFQLRKNEVALATLLFAIATWAVLVDFLTVGNPTSLSYYGTYVAVALFFIGTKKHDLDLRNESVFILRVIVWASLILALLAPNLAFAAGDSRIFEAFNPQRLSGVVGDANTLAFFGVMLLFIAVGRRHKYWVMDFFSVAVLLFLCQTRFSASIAVIGICILFIKKSTLRAKYLVIISATTSGFMLLSLALNQVLTSASVDGSDFWNTRLVIWNWAQVQIANAPVVGVGLADYQSAISGSGSYWVHAHNQFLQDMILGGWVRAALSVLVILVISRLVVRENEHMYMSLILAALVLYCLIEVPLFFDSLNYRFLAFLLVLSSLAPNQSREKTNL